VPGNIVGKALVKEILNVPVKGGDVFVYQVENKSNALFGNSFYIATFDDTASEAIWGEGDTPDSALEDAEINWSIKNPVYSNPFKKTIEILKENKERNILNNY